jgi:hypothetical protein
MTTALLLSKMVKLEIVHWRDGEMTTCDDRIRVGISEMVKFK